MRVAQMLHRLQKKALFKPQKVLKKSMHIFWFG